MARIVLFHRTLRSLLIGAVVLAPVGFAGAWQSTAQPPVRSPVVLPPPSDAQFQQAARQQQVSDQLQKSQLEQQLHQAVADQAKRPGAKDPVLQRQLDQADQAQHERDRAAQQDLVERYRNQAAALPRVIPQDAPATARSGG
ncbi:MAG TPA: hypothetical protein VN731_10610 [Rhodanobacter sp.]|nr:hypothetical protein [Rhodanobacter sp.]